MTLFGSLPSNALGGTKAAALQAVLDTRVKAGAPDLIAAVITADGAWSGAAGIDGPGGRKATATDEFYLANITKTFTAALILRLVEDGRMDLDAPLATYLGDLAVDTNKATLRQAVGMTSGLPDYGPDAAAAIQADAGHGWTTQELIADWFIAPTDVAGSRYIFGNPNYLLLAEAAEHVTGMSFAKALREQVLDPVGATRILEQGAGVVTPKPWALPIGEHLGPFDALDYGKGGVISCISSVSFGRGGSSMAGDAPSVAAWAWHLFAGDVVSPESLALMAPPAGSPGGLGLEQLPGLAGGPAYGQEGSKTGYSAILAVFPEEQVVVVLFANEQDFIVEPPVNDLLAAVDVR